MTMVCQLIHHLTKNEPPLQKAQEGSFHVTVNKSRSFSNVTIPICTFQCPSRQFLDIWVTTAFEDNNIFAGPDLYSPSANFVQRGNVTFFENYELRVTDDISRSNLVLYRESDGFNPNWSTESAFVLRYTPFLNPDMTQPGTNIRDDGSYVRLIRHFEGEKHNISLTGYAVDSGRFRLGYSYDLTWGARSIFSFDPLSGCSATIPTSRQLCILGAKTAVGDYITPDTREPRNQTYYGVLAGAGIVPSETRYRRWLGFIPTRPNQKRSKYQQSTLR